MMQMVFAALNFRRRIIASKDGKEAILNVFVSPVSDVQAYPQKSIDRRSSRISDKD